MKTSQCKCCNIYNNYNNPGRVNYILVFTVLAISQSSSGSSSYIASPAGYGDEGKWEWMARISGDSRAHGIYKNGYMNAATSTEWKDETAFGSANNQTGQWQWNDQGDNCTIYELMNYAEVQYCNTMDCRRSQHYARRNNYNANILYTQLNSLA